MTGEANQVVKGKEESIVLTNLLREDMGAGFVKESAIISSDLTKTTLILRALIS